MSTDPERSRLPFEPGKNRSRPPKNRSNAPKAAENKQSETAVRREEMVIPEVVSRRMIRRMAVLCGVPTALGISTFIASYFVVTKDWFPLPTIAVVLTSLGFFGLGVLGLSYGLISASWDEEISGSLIGFHEFRTNFGRLTEAWRGASKKD